MTRTLERSITLKDLALLVVGVVVGSGIFIVPATVLTLVDGDVGTGLIVWLIGGVLSLLGALTYGELCAQRPEAGGIYVFMRDAFGPFLAFVFGWTLFFAIAPGAIATLANAFVSYLGQLVTLSQLGGKLVAAAMVVVLAAVNIKGTRESTTVTVWATVIKASAVVLMSVALLVTGPGLAAQGGSWVPRDLSIATLPAMGIAMIGVLWAYEGWQWVTFSAGETVDANRTFPRGIVIGTMLIVAIYILANIAYVAALGPERAMASASIASTAVAAEFGPTAGRLVAIPILVAIFSAANGVVLTGSRVFYAMARDGLFFRRLGEIHPRFGTPAFSIATFCVWAMLLASTGTFQQLLTYTVFTGWIFYALGAASIFVFRSTQPNAPRPFRVPGYPLTPLLFVGAAAAIVLNTLVTQPRQGITGLGVVMIAVPAYLVWRAKRATTQTVAAQESK